MTIEELQNQYIKIPEEMKALKRWICFKLEPKEDGKLNKTPINAISGKPAKSNDSSTWTKFKLAITGCVKYGCDGIGFMLGDGIFGVDLDDSAYKKLKKGEITEEQYKVERVKFDELVKEFTSKLNSYTELSVSKKGYHIICYGNLPEGRRRNDLLGIETYDSLRYFAMTGNTINNIPLQPREEEIKELWSKYIDDGKAKKNKEMLESYQKPEFELEDDELIKKIMVSKQSEKFEKLFYAGDLSLAYDDHSRADQMLCNLLAFWTNKNKEQMDRLFRNSALYREKWERDDYRERTLNEALLYTENQYTPVPENQEEPVIRNKEVKSRQYINEKTGEVEQGYIPYMNIDDNGEPIFRIKKNFNNYTLDDTGNANRFYDYFGDLFKYNKTDKIYMFWTGKTWIRDTKHIIRKYANKLIDVLRVEEKSIEDKISKLTAQGQVDEAKGLEKYLDAFRKNITRVSNKAGKDAMLSELESFGNIPIESSEFNTDKLLLNTESGIINLETGNIDPFDSSKLMSMNTNCEVSYERPDTWLAFLQSIFYRGADDQSIMESFEIIDYVQMALGYSLTGSCSQQGMFILYGDGSNGKSTFSDEIHFMMGDYADSVESNVLMTQKVQNNSIQYTLAKLKNKRFVLSGETEMGEKLAEAEVKHITGDGQINARFAYGNEFSYTPEYKIWLSTNNKPVIVGKDLGIWRRIFLIPFLRSFSDAEKDITMPAKLKAETSKILGWCVQGYQKYKAAGYRLRLPKCLEKERTEYKEQMDVLSRFINDECQLVDGGMANAKQLYNTYKDWVVDNAEYQLRKNKFEEELVRKKFEKTSYAGETVFKGLIIKKKKLSF